jgi:hypothetical protein
VCRPPGLPRLKSAAPTPSTARIQRSLGVFGTVNIVSGVALVAVNAILADRSQPPGQAALAAALILARASVGKPALARLRNDRRRGRG